MYSRPLTSSTAQPVGRPETLLPRIKVHLGDPMKIRRQEQSQQASRSMPMLPKRGTINGCAEFLSLNPPLRQPESQVSHKQLEKPGNPHLTFFRSPETSAILALPHDQLMTASQRPVCILSTGETF